MAGQLRRTPATNYRRWWNNSWFEVEQGGQQQAGDWTPAEARRLQELVDKTAGPRERAAMDYVRRYVAART